MRPSQRLSSPTESSSPLKAELSVEQVSRLAESVRDGFPYFDAPEYGTHFLDSAASSLKCRASLDAMAEFSSCEYANVHRGAYQLSQRASERFEKARIGIAEFLGLKQPEELIFTSGATQSINVLSRALEGYLRMELEKDPARSAVLLSPLEHHSNLVPWQMLSQRLGTPLAFANVREDYAIDLESVREKALSARPLLISLSPQTNSFGGVLPSEELSAIASEVGALLHLDACQYVAHQAIDLSEVDVDFLSFSGHKLFGPNAIGGLVAKRKTWPLLEPVFFGGEMVSQVSLESATWAGMPSRFEPGTPPIAEAVGLAAAVGHLSDLRKLLPLQEMEQQLLRYAEDRLRSLGCVDCYLPESASSILSFNVKGVHPHDLATFADIRGVSIRAGLHCAQPALQTYGLSATARMSVSVYNTREDIDALIDAVKDCAQTFGV